MQGWGEAAMLCAPWGLPLGSLSCTEELLRHQWVQRGSSEINGWGTLHQKMVSDILVGALGGSTKRPPLKVSPCLLSSPEMGWCSSLGIPVLLFETPCPTLRWRSRGNAAMTICNAHFSLVD